MSMAEVNGFPVVYRVLVIHDEDKKTQIRLDERAIVGSAIVDTRTHVMLAPIEKARSYRSGVMYADTAVPGPDPEGWFKTKEAAYKDAIKDAGLVVARVEALMATQNKVVVDLKRFAADARKEEQS